MDGKKQPMRVAVGCDLAGLPLKEILKAHLETKGVEVVDFGVDAGHDVDYPDIAEQVAERVARHEFERAILICGTGIGMAIVANKVPGVRAALCHDGYSAERARRSNNAQVLTLGARVIGSELAKTLTNVWLGSEFEGGTSARKVAKIDEVDSRYRTLAAERG